MQLLEVFIKYISLFLPALFFLHVVLIHSAINMITALPDNKFAFQAGRRSQDRNKSRYLIRRQGLKLPSH
jgi:hypothetical protein